MTFPSAGNSGPMFEHLCVICTLICLLASKQPTPHSAHSLPADSPTSQRSQQDRKRWAVKTQSDLLTMGVKTPETC